MQEVERFLSEELNKRIARDMYRELQPENGLVDFCSNDYLGFARSKNVKSCAEGALNANPDYALGSGGSRLLAGNTRFAEDLEKSIAVFHHAEAGLLFNSGYNANTGLIACLPRRGDTVICDQLVHASIIDGTRLSYARRFVFKHNDPESLEIKLRHASGTVFVVVESIYSMDGDEAPLEEIVRLCRKYHAHLIVDEAHSTGIFGDYGAGIVQMLGLEKEVFARVHTFGKALGCHGAIVLGSDLLRKYLINFSRPFIYTTSLPYPLLVTIKCAYDRLSESNNNNLQINALIDLFKQKIKSISGLVAIESRSPIQCLILPGNQRVRAVAKAIRAKGYDVRAVLSPAVPEGAERIRICLHTFNTEEEINGLAKAIEQLI
jgi:8-amino-7-oxononanoate synthase